MKNNVRFCLTSLLLMIATVAGDSSSLAHTVFLPSDRSLNPFSDPFIQKVINMDRDKLYRIPQMDDNQFLLQLAQDDNAFWGPILRSDDDDDQYEALFNDKLDDQLTLQENIDGEWVELMTAGPLAVNYIGNLLVLAGKRDFPLSRPTSFTFQHIKDPNSFRATLSQVAGSMYSALIGAHTAMDRIQINVEQVPGHVKTALKLVLAGSPMLIELMLPKTLEAIGRIANESAAHARSTFDKFSLLQELIAEIIEANAYTHSSQSNVVQQIQDKINESKQQQQHLASSTNSITNQYDAARQEVEKARQEYHAAYNAIPTARGWFKKAFRRIINVVVNIVTAPLKVLGCILGLCYTDYSAMNAAIAAAETAKQNAIAKANQLLEVLRAAEQRHAALAQQQAAEQQKLAEMIKKIAALDLERMTEQEIVDILVESILQMNQIKEQWARLIQFFSKLSVQADSTQQIIVYEFIAAIKEAQQFNLLIDPADRELFVEILSITSQEIERGAHLLYVMSKTYYDVSSEYMVNQIISMYNLLLLPTDVERSKYLQSISSNTTATSAKIIQLAKQRQNEYVLKNRERQQEYEDFLQKIALEELQLSLG